MFGTWTAQKNGDVPREQNLFGEANAEQILS